MLTTAVPNGCEGGNSQTKEHYPSSSSHRGSWFLCNVIMNLQTIFANNNLRQLASESFTASISLFPTLPSSLLLLGNGLYVLHAHSLREFCTHPNVLGCIWRSKQRWQVRSPATQSLGLLGRINLLLEVRRKSQGHWCRCNH